MKKALYIILILFPFLARAQAPGYQGKRFIVSYNMDVAPNLTYIYLNSGTQAVPLQVFLNHHLNVEYVLWRRFSIAADLSYSHNQPAILDSGKRADVTTTTLGLNFIFYPNHHNTIAPVGNYFKLRVFEGSAIASGLLFDDATNAVANEKTNQEISGFGIGFGNNLVVHNRVVLTASIDMDLYMPFTNNVPLEGDVESHLLTSYLFYLKLGIGGLLF